MLRFFLRMEFGLLLALLLSLPSLAEPWLANRFAQNCAACHSPGRLNRPMAERRCSLSCQGCHVNPNGGGIRNLYGVWNQNRWLKSMDSNAYINQKIPAPIYRQTYAEKFLPRMRGVQNEDPETSYSTLADTGHEFSDSLPNSQAQSQMQEDGDDYMDGEAVEKPRRQIRRRLKRQGLEQDPEEAPPLRRRVRRPPEEIPPPPSRRSFDDQRQASRKYPRLRLIRGASYNEKNYDRWTDRNWELTQESEDQQLSRTPKIDPLHEESRKRVHAGGDLRYLMINNLRDRENTPDNIYNWLMSVDFGTRIRPIARHWQLVGEARFLNQPDQAAILQGVTTEARIRSFYTMVDELPYNSYVMAGLFRPMFGNYTPDHESLAQTISELDVRATFKSISVGFAPNVPYFNVTYVKPTISSNYSQEQGFVINGGLRLVLAGASITGSYWSTQRQNLLDQTEYKKMLSITGGLVLGRLLLNGEILRVQITNPSSENIGAVFTGDFRLRMYNEIYAVLNLAKSNVAEDLSEGEGHDFGLGLKAFLISGTELELLYVNRFRRDATLTQRRNSIQLMAHAFF